MSPQVSQLYTHQNRQADCQEKIHPHLFFYFAYQQFPARKESAEAFSDCPLKNGTMVVFSKDMNFHERMILSDSLIPLQYCAVCEKIARVSVFKFSQCFAHRCRICSPLRRQSITSQKPRTSIMNTNMIIVLNKCYLKLYV